MTTEQFINKSREIHGDRYDYSMVNYINSKTKVKIICKKHGVFEQLPTNHYKYNCLKCSGKNKLTTEEFIIKSKEIHNNKYDYLLVKYKNTNTKVKIICPKHGVFEQTPDLHIYNKCGCPKCDKSFKLNNKIFIERSNEIHNNKYDYSLVKYKNTNTKVKIICPKHGVFEQTPDIHMNGSGCPKCRFIKSRITINNFIKRSKEIHNNKYDYSLVEYVNARTKIKIICPEHGIFEQTPNKHLGHRGCPKCKMSKGEIKIKKILNNTNTTFMYEHKFDNCKYKRKLSFDFYLPDYNICIEYDGEQHFNEYNYFGGKKGFNNIKIRDKIKDNYCKENNIKLIRIKYDENINDKLKKYINSNDN